MTEMSDFDVASEERGIGVNKNGSDQARFDDGPPSLQLSPNEATLQASIPASLPPDGGIVAWVQCADAFLLWFAAWGLVNSFGVFQSYYTTTYLQNTSSSRISWIGSLQLCIYLLGSIVVGPLYDLGYLRALLIAGTFLMVYGLIITSLQLTYAGLILSQGLCTGLGMTCVFIPSVSVLPPYFSSKRALAMGFAAAGSSIGAIVFAIVFQQLLPKVGFGWTVRAMALIIFTSLIPPMITMRKRIPTSSRRMLIDKNAFRDSTFVLSLCAMFVVFAGLYVPYFYIELFAIREDVLQADRRYLAKYLIVFLNVGSFFGRLLPNLVADKVGHWNTIVPVAILTGVVGFCWTAVGHQSGLIAFAIFYGFLSGAFVSLVPVIWASLSPDPKLLGTRTGMLTVPMAAGLLIGNPLAGALVQGKSFLGLQIFCGSTVIAGGLCLLFGRISYRRSSTTWKV